MQLSWKYPLYHGGFRLREVATLLRYADLALLLNHQDLEYAVENLGVKPDCLRYRTTLQLRAYRPR